MCHRHSRTSKNKTHKTETKKTSQSSTCGQQCTMIRQEHNQSLERDVAWEKRSDVHDGSKKKKKTISVIVDKLRRREFLSITVLTNTKTITSCFNYSYFGLNLFENNNVLLVIISVRWYCVLFALGSASAVDWWLVRIACLHAHRSISSSFPVGRSGAPTCVHRDVAHR